MAIKVIISGGGTGGHIFPAIAIADALRAIHPEAEILFVGANGRMEMEKVPAHGYKIIGLDIAGFQRRNLIKNITLPFKLIKSLLKAREIVKNFKPQVAVGVGGYASGPMLFSASLLGVPTLIQEQNSFAGITNKLLSTRAKRICVAYTGMDKFFPKNKITLTGNPVRKDIQNADLLKLSAMVHFKLSAEKKTILVIGGSQGAKTINESIAANINLIMKSGYQLIWQTGKGFHEKALELTKPSPLSNGWGDAKVFDFITHMNLAYAAADVVVSRAGALSISELCIVAKPAILVPLPSAAEDHQTVNAMSLVKNNAAILVKDAEAKEKLVAETIALMGNEQQKSEMKQNISQLAKPNAASEIAEEVLKILKNIK